MPKNIDRLKIAMEEWLIRNRLDTDTRFYTMSEWRNQEEEYLNDADLVLIFEGTLHTIINSGGDIEEFDDYIESFGYYYVRGHSWNMGFYPIPDYDYRASTGTYSQKLRDERWREKSQLVKKKAGYKCQDCGNTSNLETHHCYYTNMSSGNEPWEYPLSALRCLCRSCHEDRGKSESRMRAYLARLTTNQLNSLRSGLDNAFYWFEQDAVIEFLSKLGHDDDDILIAITNFLNHRNEED